MLQKIRNKRAGAVPFQVPSAVRGNLGRRTIIKTGGKYMGEENDVILSYLEDNGRFADLFNEIYFDGRQVVKEEDLLEASEVYTAKAGEKGYMRIRDIKRRLKSGKELKILAVEAQSETDYLMPWRLLDYDCREYGKQIRQIQRKNRSAEKEKGNSVYASAGERLCEFKKTDRISPVYTICLYHGVEPWDGPRSLRDMMEFGEASEEESREWEQYFADYPMRLVCANEPMDCSGMRTALKEVFNLLPYRKDRKRLRALLQENPAYKRLDEETAQTISVLMGVKMFMEKKEKYRMGKEYDMCQALQEMMEESREEGEKKGEKKGISVLIQDNRDEGVDEERIAQKLQKYFGLSKEQAWERLKEN